MIAQESLKPQGAVPVGKTLNELLLAKGNDPAHVAAKYKVNGAWQEVTWGATLDRIRRISEGLVSIGVKPGDRVCILSSTRYEWVLADLAILGAGAVTVPIYASNLPHECEYIIQNSGAKHVFFDNDNPEGKLPGRWSRLKEIAGKLPNVEHFLGFDVASDPGSKLTSLKDLEQKGAEALKANPRGFEERSAKIASDDLACILYTSGTTGNPKGVMLTQGNWAYQATAVARVGLMTDTDLVLLFLPLAHSFGKVVEAAWLGQKFTLAFAESIDRLIDNCAEVKATVMPAVPRIFEKAYAKVVGDASAQPGVKGKLFNWAMAEFEQYVAAKNAGKEYSGLQWTLAKKLVFSKVKEKLNARFGGRMRLFISGSAPLSNKIHYFFELCGLTIVEGYGLTETSAPTHANRPNKIKIGTVGAAFPETEVKIAEDGEILVKGPQIMKGYYNLPEETAKVFVDGWFATGDIGVLDSDGYLKITDRKKDLMKTSGGKYIAPQELEGSLKAAEPLISQVMIHGDRRKYVSALVTIAEDAVKKWASENNISGTYAELTQRPEVRARVQAAIDGINATQPSYATVKKFSILDHDWSQDTGELTPTLKVKRKHVNQKYKPTLDGFYDGESFD